MSRTRKSDTRSKETRAQILKAAVEVFANHGFDGASTRQISRLAGVNQGLVTYYFSSKENLWKEAMRSVFGQMNAKLLPIIQESHGLDTRARYKHLIQAFVRHAAHHPEQMRLMVREGTADMGRMAWLVDEFVKPIYQIYIPFILEGQSAGILPPGAPVHYFYIFVGGASLIFSSAPECRYLTGVDPTHEAVIQAHAEAFCALVMRD